VRYLKRLLKNVRRFRVCADAGYRKTTEGFVEKMLKKTIEISERIIRLDGLGLYLQSTKQKALHFVIK
jgi:hypothetical protein